MEHNENDLCEQPKLEELLNALTAARKMTVCITDLSGIFRYDKLNISEKYRIHSSRFCSTVAKSTPGGLAMCLACKDKANSLAETGKSFYGRCRFGICESVCPVEFDGRVRCIVYCGGYDTDYDALSGTSRLESACKRSAISATAAKRVFGECVEKASSHEPYMTVARFAADAIKRILCEISRNDKLPTESYTDYICRYTRLEYASDLSLDTFSNMLFVNAKHLGRLFAHEKGMSYRQYLSDIRMKNAMRLIMTTDMSITDIALTVGFTSVTYFNHSFREKFGDTPTHWRNTIPE